MPKPDAPHDPPITDLLSAARSGDPAAQDAVARAVQGTLRELAAVYLGRERGNHTLQPTALVNEAYLRLMGQTSVEWKSRSHFFGIAAKAMRRILVDHARRAHAARRDRALQISLDGELIADPASFDGVHDILGVHEALDALTALDPRQAQVVELKFFAGLSLDEIAAVLDISRATVTREWAMSRLWLHRRLADA